MNTVDAVVQFKQGTRAKAFGQTVEAKQAICPPIDKPDKTNGPNPFFSHHFINAKPSVTIIPPKTNKSRTCIRFDRLKIGSISLNSPKKNDFS